jgi:hypothetical protein
MEINYFPESLDQVLEETNNNLLFCSNQLQAKASLTA